MPAVEASTPAPPRCNPGTQLEQSLPEVAVTAMATSPQALFHAAREEHARTARRAYPAVVALLLFHAAVVTPFVEQERRRTHLADEETRLADATSAAASAGAALAAGREAAGERIEPALRELLRGVRGDLDRLGAAVDAARGEPLPEPVEEVDVDDAGGELDDASPGEAGAPIDLDPATRDALREARNRYALLGILEPVVEERIVGPRFDALGQAWREEVLPALEAGIDEAAGELAALGPRWPEGSAEVAAAEGAVAELRRVARDLAFQPPEQPFWWAAPEDAPTFELTLTPAVRERLLHPLALDRLAVAAGGAEAALGDLAGRAESARESFRTTSEAERGRLGDFAATLARLGVDLRGVVLLFPLLLGVLLAAVQIRRGQRLARLAVATRLAVAAGEPRELRRWCLAELGGPRHFATVAAARGAAVRQALGALLLALLWIAAAAAHLLQLEGLDRDRWLLTVIAGATAAVVATVHRLVAVRRAARTLDGGHPLTLGKLTEPAGGTPAGGTPAGGTPAEEAADESAGTPADPGGALDHSPDDRGTGFLDARPLRR